MPPKKFSQEELEDELKKQKKQWEDDNKKDQVDKEKKYQEELAAQRKTIGESQREMAAMKLQLQEVNKSAGSPPPPLMVVTNTTSIAEIFSVAPTNPIPPPLPATTNETLNNVQASTITGQLSPTSATTLDNQRAYYDTLSQTYFPDRNNPIWKIPTPQETYNLLSQFQNKGLSHTSIPLPTPIYTTPPAVTVVQDPI